jgi:hypothetical protein
MSENKLLNNLQSIDFEEIIKNPLKNDKTHVQNLLQHICHNPTLREL